MGFVCVDIGVCSHRHARFNQRLHNHEASREDGVAFVLVVYRETIVAARLYAAILVRNGKSVVGVKRIGVQRFLDVVNGAAVCKSFTVVRLEDTFRHTPVGFAMLQSVDIAMILVREVVETDVYRFAVERSYRH